MAKEGVMLRRRGSRCLAAILAVLAVAGSAVVASAAPPAPLPPDLSFDGAFDQGLSAWNAAGGGAQCANYGTPATAPRARGNVYLDPTNVVDNVQAARFDLPASQPTFPLQACELTNMRSEPLGSSDYYGFMFYVPEGWTDGTVPSGGFWGIATAQFHFQNIWGSPIEFELHSDHMTLALETGACNNHLSSDPGCTWRSNADDPSGPGNLGAQYVVPAPMQEGVWHEVIMYVHWAADTTGAIQVWTRVEGGLSWTQTVNLSGYPTVQWDVTQGCCSSAVADKIGAYRGPSSSPVSVWEDNAVIGPSFASVAATMPVAVGDPVITFGSPGVRPIARTAAPDRARRRWSRARGHHRPSSRRARRAARHRAHHRADGRRSVRDRRVPPRRHTRGRRRGRHAKMTTRGSGRRHHAGR